MRRTADVRVLALQQAERKRRGEEVRQRVLHSRPVRAIGLVLALVVGFVAFNDLVDYGTLVGTPNRVHFCGRDYDKGTWSWSQAQVQAWYAKAAPAGAPPVQLVRVGTAPWIYGDPVLVPASDTTKHGSICGLGLWVQTGPDAYTEYSLSGGP